MSASSTIAGFELSFNQRELWLQGGDMGSYYTILSIDINGPLDKQRLLKSLQSVIGRHEILQFRCHRDPDSVFPYQVSAKDAEPDFREGFISEEEVNKMVTDGNAYLNGPYDPLSDKPARFFLGCISGQKYILVMKLFALWGDSYSSEILFHELTGEYSGLGLDVERQIIDYWNFARWQNDLMNDPDEEGAGFWENYKFYPGERIIPFERRSLSVFAPKKTVIGLIAGDRYTGIEEVCSSYGIGMADFMLTIFSIYLSGFSDGPVTIGYMPFRRNYRELDWTLGLVNKTLPLTFDKFMVTDFAGTVQYIRKCTEEIVAWGDYFYPDKAKDPASRADPYFNYCYEYIEPGRADFIDSNGTSFQLSSLSSFSQPFSVKLTCLKDGGCLKLELQYDEGKFSGPGIDLLVEQFKQLLLRHVDKNTAHSGISHLEAELIRSTNDTGKSFDTEKTIIKLLEEQAARTPDNIALVYEATQLSFKALIESANQVADYIGDKFDVRGGDLVGVILDRSEWLPIVLLGILKAGAGYVPIDPEYPEERISYILMDCKAKMLITEEHLPEIRSFFGKNKGIARPVAGGDDLAYVIYTSGSTGNPKGCIIRHRNLSNYLQWADGYYFEGEEEKGNSILITSIAFDLSVTCLFIPLIRGKKLYLGKKDKEIAGLLEEAFNNPEIDMLKLTPAHLVLLKGLSITRTNISIVICGGEQLTKEHINILWNISQDIRIYNEYGPTETTVGSIVKEIKKSDEKILIGTPIGNTEILIIKEDDSPAPIGVVGQIYIGGQGVGAGYLGQPGMSADKFVMHPLEKNTPVYKTGDSGRWLQDGNIEFLGRRDGQVKIRGFRVELSEIENVLQGYEGIDVAIVMVKANEEGEQELIGYVQGNSDLNITGILSYLKKKLPSYMLPGNYVLLDKIPLTPNGKIDRANLLHMGGTALSANNKYVPPRNPTEEQLVGIWQEVLNKERVGIRDNFFELGGHSLKATRLANKIHKAFNVKIGLKELFANVVLEDQAILISKAKAASFTPITPAEVRRSYVLSSSQLRLWIMNQFDDRKSAYNMPGVYVFEGDVNEEVLEFSFISLIERHEILRTVFREDEEGEIRQFIRTSQSIGFKLSCLDLRPDDGDTVDALMQQEFSRSFDLASGPLIRACLYQVAEKKWVFTYIIHHIIGDGWSMNILIGELLSLYNARSIGENAKLASLRVQYKDYAVWQQKQLRDGSFALHKEYWNKQFEGELPLLEFPADRPRPAVKTYHGDAINRPIETRLSKGLKELLRDQDATLFMGLLTTAILLLYKYTYQQDFIIGSPIAGREHMDLDDQIGLYLNTLALRIRFSERDSFQDILNNVRDVTLGAYEHQVYPFDELVNDLQLPMNKARNPLFDVMLILQNIDLGRADREENLHGVNVSGYGGGRHPFSKFDFTFEFAETGEEIYFNVVYNSDIYNRDTIVLLMTRFSELLDTVILKPSAPLCDIDLPGWKGAASLFNMEISSEF